MKFPLVILLIFFSAFSYSQNVFELSDTLVEVGDEHLFKIRWVICKGYSFFNDNEFAEESKMALDSLAEFLTLKRGVKIQISDHKDSRGTDTSNLRLTQLRADHIKRYLLKKGIDSNRIIAIGCGESQPIHTDKEINEYKVTDKLKYEQLHQENQRTIVKIIHIE